MSAVKITNSVYSVGILNPNMRIFDIVMKTDYGTTYNSYIIKAEKTALVETVHLRYFDRFIENISEVCDVKSIDYLIMNHNEPDHSGSIAKLLELNPDITIIVSQAGSLYLKNITNNPNAKVQVVKDGDTLDLGGKVLKFINAPFLHWPDSMFTWDEDEKVLFSCDFLGSHYCEPYTLDTHIAYPKAYEVAFKGYYDAIFGPFKKYVLAGLSKIEGLDINYVCTSHGPVITKEGRLNYVKAMYKQWSQPHKNEVPQIPVFYCTAYGNTGLIAEAIKEGIESVLPNANVTLYDLVEHDIAALGAVLNASDAFAIGSPTLNRDALPPVWQLISHIDAVNIQKRPVLLFGSYGWSGEAVGFLKQRLTSLKLNVFGDGFKVTFVPSEEDLKNAKELGAEFAKSL